LPMLRLGDIKDMRPYPAYRLVDAFPVPCLYHDIPTRQIDYAYCYFDAGRVAFEDLPYVGVLLRLLGKLDTRAHTADELDSLIHARLGSLRFSLETYGDESDPSIIRPKIVVAASSLAENIAFLAQLPQEVWSSTLFDDTARIKDILQQNRIALEQDFVNSGQGAALLRASSYYTPSAIVREQVYGIDFYRFLKGLLVDFDQAAGGLVSRLYTVAERLFVKDGAVVSFTGSQDQLARFWEEAGSLGLASAETEEAGVALAVPEPCRRNEAFIVPTDICFAAKGYDRRLLGLPYSGTWQVASRILSYDYLWQELRVKGGAYGGGFKADRGGSMQFYSYRDPNLDTTLACFDGAAPWLASFDPKKDEMLGYIISSVAGFDAPKKPREIAHIQDAEFFKGLDPDWRSKARNEVLGTTPADIVALAPAFDQIAAKDARCVFGSQDILRATATDFDTIDLLS